MINKQYYIPINYYPVLFFHYECAFFIVFHHRHAFISVYIDYKTRNILWNETLYLKKVRFQVKSTFLFLDTTNS